MTALDRITNALIAHGRSGRGSSWQCPAHEDAAPSLSIGRNAAGDGAVVNCHAGCQTTDVMTALGMGLSDLYDEPRTERPQHVRPEITEYPYVDESGVVLCRVRRYEPGFNDERKTFRQFRADGTPGVKDVRKVPYNLPAVIAAAQAGGLILVGEGEKCADALTGVGMTATTNIGGAGKWRDEYSRYFVGASEVVVIADRDEPGRRHATQVAESLDRVGVPVRVVEPAVGKDAFDHVTAGKGFHDLVDTDWRPTNPKIPTQSQPADDDRLSGISGTQPGMDGWDEPISIDAVPLPALPTTNLGALGEFVEAQAASLQVPPDLVAFAALGTIAAATGGRRRVQVKPGWYESTALYLVALADSSDKKTPALNAAAAPLRDVETELIEAARPEVEALAQQIRVTTAQMTRAEQKAAGDKPENALADAEGARMKLLELGDTPELPRLLIGDATLEAIGKVMAGNKGRLGVLASEAGLLKIAAGLYGSKGQANTDLLLEAYSGSPYTIDRTGRPSARMASTFLSIALLIQTGVLAGVERKNPEFRENGLLGRFLYALPAPSGLDTFDSPSVPFDIADDYAKRIRAVIERVWNCPETTTLTLDSGATQAFGAFYDGFAARRQPGGDLHDIADWAGKLRGQLIRVAACLTVYENPEATVITHARMVDVLGLAPYFIRHAQAAFDLMSADHDGRLKPLRDIVAWLRSRPEKVRAKDFSARDAWQALKGRRWATDMEAMTDALNDLEDYGWIAQRPAPERPAGSRGRPPSPRYDVHPWIVNPPANRPEETEAS
ncbi:DUF3987 domain-containing protein [Yinghuangia sp. YIM S10712]|uniref:YfjI family protein n=1 Tax=Yinghuangia sp. YIM S10712 TaxID=3436930 RepID=UPI003F536D13